MEQSHCGTDVFRGLCCILSAGAIVLLVTPRTEAAPFDIERWPITIWYPCSDDPDGECVVNDETPIVGNGDIELDFRPLWLEYDAWYDSWQQWEECTDIYDDVVCEGMGLVEPDEELHVTAQVIDARLTMFGHTFESSEFDYGYWFVWGQGLAAYEPYGEWMAVGNASGGPEGRHGDPGLTYLVGDGMLAFSFSVNGNKGSYLSPNGNARLSFWEPAVQLELKSSVVAGCKSVTGTVTLADPAPAGGRVIALGG